MSYQHGPENGCNGSATFDDAQTAFSEADAAWEENEWTPVTWADYCAGSRSQRAAYDNCCRLSDRAARLFRQAEDD